VANLPGGLHAGRKARWRVLVFLPVLLLAASLVLCACGAPKPVPEQDLSVTGDEPERSGTPAEVQADSTGTADVPGIVIPERPPYRLTVGDRLAIEFFYYPAYDVTVLVRPDGMVTIPLVGEVQAEGKMPSEIEAIVRSRYAEVLAAPEVSVIVTEFADQRIFVFGEVNKPGAFDLKGTATVLDAIAGAGGITYNGRSDSVILIRQQADGMFAGTRVNLQDVLAGRPGESIFLHAGDVVYVPLTFIAKVDIFVDQFFAQLTPVWYFFIAGREVMNPEGRFIIGR
jgi:polysaccharide export outer membrane protein